MGGRWGGGGHPDIVQVKTAERDLRDVRVVDGFTIVIVAEGSAAGLQAQGLSGALGDVDPVPDVQREELFLVVNPDLDAGDEALVRRHVEGNLDEVGDGLDRVEDQITGAFQSFHGACSPAPVTSPG